MNIQYNNYIYVMLSIKWCVLQYNISIVYTTAVRESKKIYDFTLKPAL